MNRPRLIKKEEQIEKTSTPRPAEARRSNHRRKREVVLEWIDDRRRERDDPRKAFAALFSTPQVS